MDVESGHYVIPIGFWDERNWQFQSASSWLGYECDCEEEVNNYLLTGDNRYTLYIRDPSSRSVHAYELNIRRHAPMLDIYSVIGNIDDNDENDLQVNARYAGEDTWVVYMPEAVKSLDLFVNSNSVTLEGDNEAGVIIESAANDRYIANNLSKNVSNVIGLVVTDKDTGEHFNQKLIVYNGIPNLDASD